MTILGFICAESGQPVSIEECLHHSATNPGCCDWPYALLYNLAKDVHKDKVFQEVTDETLVRVTDLTWCRRQRYLKDGVDYYETLQSLYRIHKGNIFHDKLASVPAVGDEIIEKRFYRKTPYGVALTGKMDRVWPGKAIMDYKVPTRIYNTASISYEIQLNLYRWILLQPEKHKPIPVSSLLVGQLGNQFPRTVDVRIWKTEEVDRYLEDTLGNLHDIPPIPKNAGVQLCTSCACKETCIELNAEGN